MIDLLLTALWLFLSIFAFAAILGFFFKSRWVLIVVLTVALSVFNVLKTIGKNHDIPQTLSTNAWALVVGVFIYAAMSYAGVRAGQWLRRRATRILESRER
jgi:hypothetical protein